MSKRVKCHCQKMKPRQLIEVSGKDLRCVRCGETPKADMPDLSEYKVIACIPAPSQPRHGTSSPSGIVGHGGE